MARIRTYKILFIMTLLVFAIDLFFDALDHCDFLIPTALASRHLPTDMGPLHIQKEDTQKSEPLPSTPYHEENCCPCNCHLVKVVFTECYQHIHPIEIQQAAIDTYQLLEGIPPQVFRPPKA